MIRVVLLAHPGHPRTESLSAALRAAGMMPQSVAWRDWLAAPERLTEALASPCVLKLEAPGEDAVTQHALIQQGALRSGLASPPPLDHGELAHGALSFLGFEAALSALSTELASRPWVRCVNPPADILTMCDKLACRAVLAAADVPQPLFLGAVAGFSALEAAMQAHGCMRVFVKPRYGSSAAGVVALARNAQGRLQATSSVEMVRAGGRLRLFNTLRVRAYRDRDVVALIDALAPHHPYAERWVPKPVRAGHGFDVRMLTLGGVPQHRVCRAAPQPMTNLHLGGVRGVLEAWGGEGDVMAAEAVARRTAACFPDSAVAGIDLIVQRGRVHVLEVNAFGDWLPRLTWQGQTVHEAQAAWLRHTYA